MIIALNVIGILIVVMLIIILYDSYYKETFLGYIVTQEYYKYYNRDGYTIPNTSNIKEYVAINVYWKHSTNKFVLEPVNKYEDIVIWTPEATKRIFITNCNDYYNGFELYLNGIYKKKFNKSLDIEVSECF